MGDQLLGPTQLEYLRSGLAYQSIASPKKVRPGLRDHAQAQHQNYLAAGQTSIIGDPTGPDLEVGKLASEPGVSNEILDSSPQHRQKASEMPSITEPKSSTQVSNLNPLKNQNTRQQAFRSRLIGVNQPSFGAGLD